MTQSQIQRWAGGEFTAAGQQERSGKAAGGWVAGVVTVSGGTLTRIGSAPGIAPPASVAAVPTTVTSAGGTYVGAGGGACERRLSPPPAPPPSRP